METKCIYKQQKLRILLETMTKYEHSPVINYAIIIQNVKCLLDRSISVEALRLTNGTLVFDDVRAKVCDAL